MFRNKIKNEYRSLTNQYHSNGSTLVLLPETYMIENCDNEDYFLISIDPTFTHFEREFISKQNSEKFLSQYKHHNPEGYKNLIAEYNYY